MVLDFESELVRQDLGGNGLISGDGLGSFYLIIEFVQTADGKLKQHALQSPF
jgi:hypothetical protein